MCAQAKALTGIFFDQGKRSDSRHPYRSSIKIVTFFVFALLCINYHADARGGHKGSKASKKELIFYPSAPDTPHIQFLTCFSGSSYMGRRSGFAKFILGPDDVKSLVKPYGICFNNGKLYACDPAVAGIGIFDFNTKKYINFIPGGSGVLNTPMNCAVDKNGILFVTDPALQQVNVYDSSLTCVGKIKDTGDFKPSDIAIYKDTIWVTNTAHHTLNRYDVKTRAFIDYFNADNSYGEGDEGFLYAPYNLFVSDDKVYVTDFGDFKIKIYDHNGKYISSVGSYGTGLGQFVRPKGIACDKDNYLYVTDAGFENVQIFNTDARLLMFFGGPYKGHGDMWLPAKVVIDYDNLSFFQKYVDSRYNLKYLIIVSNQYGPDKINVYGFIEPKAIAKDEPKAYSSNEHKK
jgi:hypothetical protein